MRLSRGILLFIASSILAFTGCANGNVGNDGVENVGKSSEALRALQDNEKLGSMSYGQTNTVNYTDNPLYRAYSFTANAGDNVDIWVKNVTPTSAIAWLLAADYSTLVESDPTNGTSKDAHINYTISTASTYWIAMRESNQENATFTVSLNGNSAPSNVFDPNVCAGGTRMTKNQILHYFAPGTDTSNPIANVTVYERWRNCNTATGCAAWQTSSKPVFWTQDSATVSNGTFYAKVGSGSNMYLYFKRALTDANYVMVSETVGSADPLGVFTPSGTYLYDGEGTTINFSPDTPLQANTTCFQLLATGSTSANSNSDYTQSQIVFYGATLAPTN